MTTSLTLAGLHGLALGDHGSRVVFCHGLFGQGRNWLTVAKAFEAEHRVLMLDMPDHGRSPWTASFDYIVAADRVAEAIAAGGDDPVALVGHSMGGKIAMLVALRHPELVARLAVIDIAPVDYNKTSEFAGYIGAMRALPLATLTSRADADRALTAAVPDPSVRGFLLQNLRREGDHWRWQMNLDGLEAGLAALTGFPADSATSYGGPVLWMRGAESNYVRDADLPAMEALFPRVRRVSVKGAGHWVHADQPGVVTAILKRFVDAGTTESPGGGTPLPS